MDNTLNFSSPAAPVSEAANDGGLASLRSAVLLMLVGLILLGLGVNIFLLRQVGLVRRQVAEVDAFVQEYTTNSAPLMQKFITELQGFTKVYPDFTPVLGKYIKTEGPVAQAPPAAQMQASPPPKLQTPPSAPKPAGK